LRDPPNPGGQLGLADRTCNPSAVSYCHLRDPRCNRMKNYALDHLLSAWL